MSVVCRRECSIGASCLVILTHWRYLSASSQKCQGSDEEQKALLTWLGVGGPWNQPIVLTNFMYLLWISSNCELLQTRHLLFFPFSSAIGIIGRLVLCFSPWPFYSSERWQCPSGAFGVSECVEQDQRLAGKWVRLEWCVFVHVQCAQNTSWVGGGCIEMTSKSREKRKFTIFFLCCDRVSSVSMTWISRALWALMRCVWLWRWLVRLRERKGVAIGWGFLNPWWVEVTGSLTGSSMLSTYFWIPIQALAGGRAPCE